ncbi:MAG: hypothetical protein NC201_03920 [Prevotella sp.]|nr:hypothetical protein [Bacteroides sp.]MCM1366375.1 hypothetical protein [Prevotella sp.]MCM1436696.1 hypothetical protein [Prevotella sp.]
MKSFTVLLTIILSAITIFSAFASDPVETAAAKADALAAKADSVSKSDTTRLSVLPADIQLFVDEAAEFCSKPYLEMEQSELDRLKSELAGKNYPKAEEAYSLVSRTLSLWHEIDGYNRLLYVPFQYEKVKHARERIYEMQDEMSPAQYDEIYEKIDSPLSRYYHGVKFFQEVLITEFNSMVEQPRKEKNMSAVRKSFNELINRPDVKENIQKRIGAVPWLAKKYEDYKQYIMNRNSSPRGPIAQDIMRISLE